jgi:hypothetical protein
MSEKKKVKIMIRVTPPGFSYRKIVDGKVKEFHDILKVGDVIEVDPAWNGGKWYEGALAGGMAAPCDKSERVTAFPQNGAFSNGPSRNEKPNPVPAKADRDDKHGDG